MFGATSLTYLNMSRNLIVGATFIILTLKGEFPDAFDRATSLTLLDMSDNKLTLVPLSTGSLKKLRNLNYKGNLIQLVPTSLYLDEVEDVDFSNNLLDTFPKTISHFPQIRSLRVSCNRFSTVRLK